MAVLLINGTNPDTALQKIIKFLNEDHTEPVEICFEAFPESPGDPTDARSVDLRENAIQLLRDAAKQTSTSATSIPKPLPGFLNRFTFCTC